MTKTVFDSCYWLFPLNDGHIAFRLFTARTVKGENVFPLRCLDAAKIIRKSFVHVLVTVASV
jgi:hypothetical protein